MSVCNSVHGYLGPRKGLHYAYCTNERGHDAGHYNSTLRMAWDGPVLYWDEFEHTRPKVKTPLVRKVKICKHCEKQIRTDGANDACVCKEIEATRRQGIMFADERERSFREDAQRELQDDIDWIAQEWEVQRLANIAASEEPYYAEF